MPKILKKTLFSAIAALCIILLSTTFTFAQCVVKKSRSGTTTIAEVPDTYVYNRTATDYNGLGIKLTESRRSGKTTTSIKLNYTFSDALRKPDRLIILFEGADAIVVPLRFIRSARTDNKKIASANYDAQLPDDVIATLAASPVSSVQLASQAGYKFSETFTVDRALFQQMLQCLKNSN